MSPAYDTAKLNHAYAMADRFIERDFGNNYTEVLDAWHEGNTHPDWPSEMVYVVLEAVDGYGEGGDPYGNRFTKAAVDFGRENGLEVMDHVVKLGYEAEDDYDTEAVVIIRFGVTDDYDN